MEVREYEARDLDACRALYAEIVHRHREIYDDSTIGGDEPGAGFDAHLQRVGAERVWVAVCNGETAGLVSLIHNGEGAEIEPVVVAARYRGKGVGRLLLTRAEAEARKLGVLCLYVRPVARNRGAILFFHEVGFRILGQIQLFQWLGDTRPGQWSPGHQLFNRNFDF